jgi:hypothetical protein
MVLQRKSNAGTMNPHRSSGDEWAIADTQLKPARTDNTVSWLAINDPRSDKCRMLLSIFTAAKICLIFSTMWVPEALKFHHDTITL